MATSVKRPCLRRCSHWVIAPWACQKAKRSYNLECESGLHTKITLQRHFSASTKFAHEKSRFCGRKQRGKEAFCAPINPCSRRTCFRNVDVGVLSGSRDSSPVIL